MKQNNTMYFSQVKQGGGLRILYKCEPTQIFSMFENFSSELELLQTKDSTIQGVPEKMSLSEIGALLTKGHFFWDTWYRPKKNTLMSITAFM